jgi:hypothetical protein
VAEEHASSDEPMRLLTSAFFELSDEFWGHLRAPKLINEFVVINTFVTRSLDFGACNNVFTFFLLYLIWKLSIASGANL